ncbi:MAG: hypothetical protein ACLS3M_01215 [Collinsella sp.]
MSLRPVALDRKPVYPIRNYGSAMRAVLYDFVAVGGLDCSGGHDEGLG